MRTPIRDLQLIFVGMLLAAPDKMKEEGLKSFLFSDTACHQLATVLMYDENPKEAKQKAIADFVDEVFGEKIDPEFWREELMGLLNVNADFASLCNRMHELEHITTDTKQGKVMFMQHFGHLANGYNAELKRGQG